MYLYFMRHGESRNNELEGSSAYFHSRYSEPDLSALGQRQAIRAAQFIAGELQLTVGGTGAAAARATGAGAEENEATSMVDLEQPNNPYVGDGLTGVTHLYASPHLRAIRTAAESAKALHLPIRILEDIHEAGGVVHFDPQTSSFIGDRGCTREEALDIYQDIHYPDHLDEGGWWNRRPHEREDARMARAHRAFEYFMRNHAPEDRVLVVSHCHFYVYFCCAVLGMRYRDGYWLTLNNCALTRFVFDRRGVRLDYHNRQDYLAPDCLS